MRASSAATTGRSCAASGRHLTGGSGAGLGSEAIGVRSEALPCRALGTRQGDAMPHIERPGARRLDALACDRMRPRPFGHRPCVWKARRIATRERKPLDELWIDGEAVARAIPFTGRHDDRVGLAYRGTARERPPRVVAH